MSISLFGIHLYLYGVLVALGILTGWWLAARRAGRYGLTAASLERIFPWVLIGGLIGARTYHVLDYWHWYGEHPVEVIALWEGGLAIYGALIGGFLALWWAACRSGLRLLPLLDLIAPSLSIGQALGRMGNFINQEGFGPPTTLPWGINSSHPTQLYEAAWLALGTIGMLKLEQKKPVSQGHLFGWYLVWMGIGRFLFEFLRIDTAMVGMIKVAQVLSIAATAGGIYMLRRRASV